MKSVVKFLIFISFISIILSTVSGCKNNINEEEAGILYTKFDTELYSLVNSGEYEGGFLLPKLNADDIFEVVLDNVKMPHKTTYFYPKILSGLVFKPLWNNT